MTYLMLELEEWKRRLAPAFTIPELRHNLRNSNEVASIGGLAGSGLSANRSKALPTAPAPRPPPTLPAILVFQPIHLVHEDLSVLQNLAAAGLHSLLSFYNSIFCCIVGGCGKTFYDAIGYPSDQSEWLSRIFQ